MGKILKIAAVFLFVIFLLQKAGHGAEGNLASSSSIDAQKTEADGENQGQNVAALVNGVEITREAVDTMMKSMAKGKVHGADSEENPEDLHKEALNQLILQELAYQKALSDGVTVDQKDVDNVLADIKKKLGDEGKYMEFLDKEKISEAEMRKRVQRNLVLSRFFNALKKEIYDNSKVSEEELKSEYEKDKEKYTRPEKIVVVDVVFFLKPDDADSLKKTNEILEKIQTDKEKDPWNLVLDGTFIVRDLEMKDGIQEEEIYNQAKKIQVGELSGVFLSSGTLHIIKLKEYTPFKQYTFEEVKSAVERKARGEAQKKFLAAWEAGLKKDARIEIMESGKSNE
jgi:parvulin-like peptidyl-prolyl isomerase